MKHFTLPREGGLIEKDLPKGVLHGREKIWTEIYADAADASRDIADIVVKAINDHRASGAAQPFKLGICTGRTPSSVYKFLVEDYAAGRVSFKGVQVVGMDEYFPSPDFAEQSSYRRLHKEFVDLVDFNKEDELFLDGTVPQAKISAYCAEFDKKARGMDLLLAGIGEGGQIGFNEAGATPQSRTRTVRLSYRSRKRQAKNFNGAFQDAPKLALTLGMSTVLSAKQVILMAWGESKTDIVSQIVESHFDAAYPASFFQMHDNVRLYVDETSGAKLSRVEAPWLVGPCEWTPKFRRKAVVWLCQVVGKPILKLTQRDYLENSLGELLDVYGSYDKINIEVFNDLQHTISGWPGGKPNADDSTRPVASTPFPKTVLIFSPHPDDDVISMGGTFIRLVHQGHKVHVAYETSGDLAVHDDVVLQHMDAARQMGLGDKVAEVVKLVESKVPGAPEPKELLAIKAAIRRSEARGAVHSFGLKSECIHFLNLPFYESGGVKKLPKTQADIDIIKALIMDVRPNQIYMAGDLADPHGTHRVCTEAALEAISQLVDEGNDWLLKADLWLYRGAWMEWELGSVDMAVPISPDEMVEKRHSIFRHLSQKDIVPFPGEDPREFWQRAEERTQNTAKLYDALGMAEYQAIEVFHKVDMKTILGE